MATLNVMDYKELQLSHFYKIDGIQFIQFGKAHVLSPIVLINGSWYFLPESVFKYEHRLNGKIIRILNYFDSSGVFIYESYNDLMNKHFSNIDNEFKKFITTNELYDGESELYEDVILNSFISYIKTSDYKNLLHDELLKYYIVICKETTYVMCEYCRTLLKNKVEYTNHLENFRHCICKYCEKDFFLPDELYIHFLNEHSENRQNKQFQCGKCKRRFGYLRNLKHHMKNKGH